MAYWQLQATTSLGQQGFWPRADQGRVGVGAGSCPERGEVGIGPGEDFGNKQDQVAQTSDAGSDCLARRVRNKLSKNKTRAVIFRLR